MHVAEIEFENAFCFRGRHRVVLEPKVYAVGARREDDPGRSNWQGKSSLLKLLGPLPLYGWHEETTKDGWINRDCKSALSVLRLSDGAEIVREQKKGKAMIASVTLPDGSKVGSKGAQDAIDQLVGFSKDEFLSAPFFAQKRLARLVGATPADLVKEVGRWLELEPLRQCERAVRDDLIAATRARVELEREISGLEGRLEEASQAGDPKKLKRELKEAQKRFEQLEAKEQARSRWEELHDKAAEYDSIVERGKRAKDELELLKAEVSDSPSEELDEARRSESEARDDLDMANRLFAGQFDGGCPVDGRECPVKDEINACGRKGKGRLEEALQAFDQAKRRRSEAERRERTRQERLREVYRKESALEQLRAEVRKLQKDAEDFSEDEEAPELEDAEEAELDDLETRIPRLRATLEQAEATVRRSSDLRTRLEQKRGQAESLLARIAQLNEAVFVFGRSGAQRRYAERSLSAIDSAAVSLLTRCGVDLGVRVEWCREGKDPADVCSSCGSPFPSSRKIKACGCGAPRGRKLIEEPRIVLSDRSGAAEDLGGFGLQLSAFGWMRALRSSSWSTAYIDEPFGALDEANKRGLAAHVSAMLGSEHGVGQAFVVTHDREIADGLPGRISIVGGDGGSRLE